MSFELKNVVIFLKIAVSTIPTIRQYPFTLLGGESKGTVRVNCLAQEHKTVSRQGSNVPVPLDKRTNHEATLGCVQFNSENGNLLSPPAVNKERVEW